MTATTTPVPPRTVDPRTLAFWTMIAVAAYGLWAAGRELLPQIRAFPGSAVVDVLLLIITLALGLWLVRRLLRPVQAPPWSGTWLAVMWGSLAACAIALLFNGWLLNSWGRALDADTAATWGASLTAPLNEEFAKIAGVVLLAAVSTRLIRGAADGFVYGALVGLGFQVFENVGYGFTQIIILGGLDAESATAQSVILRFFLTGIGSHWAMTAVAGAGVGYLVGAVGRPLGRRVAAAVGALLLAMTMHFLFDLPVMSSLLAPIGAGTLLNFAVAVVVYLAVRRDFRSRWQAALDQEVAAGVVEPDEARSLSRRRARKRHLKRFAAGPEREAAARRQRAQLDLIEHVAPARDTVAAAAPWRGGAASPHPGEHADR